MNLGDLLTDAARRHPDRPAVVHGERIVSWAQMNARVDAFAHAMAGLGIGPATR